MFFDAKYMFPERCVQLIDVIMPNLFFNKYVENVKTRRYPCIISFMISVYLHKQNCSVLSMKIKNELQWQFLTRFDESVDLQPSRYSWLLSKGALSVRTYIFRSIIRTSLLIRHTINIRYEGNTKSDVRKRHSHYSALDALQTSTYQISAKSVQWLRLYRAYIVHTRTEIIMYF